MNIIRLIKENKPYPRADESVLHYLVCTENRDFESALRCLRMAAREWHGISRLAMGVSSATFLVSLLSAASGVGAWVALALVSTVFTGSQAWGSRKECQVREKELELLKSSPELLELMHQAYSKGVPPLKLVHSYNAIVGAFDTESGTCQGTMPVQAFAGQMQGAIATAKEVHQALGQLDVASLPESGLYPHLIDGKPSLPPSLQDKPVDSTMGSRPTITPSSANDKWINNFISQTALIWGNQGSGKSWMARYITKLKKDKGYRVVVLDPDSNHAEWQGVRSVFNTAPRHSSSSNSLFIMIFFSKINLLPALLGCYEKSAPKRV